MTYTKFLRILLTIIIVTFPIVIAQAVPLDRDDLTVDYIAQTCGVKPDDMNGPHMSKIAQEARFGGCGRWYNTAARIWLVCAVITGFLLYHNKQKQNKLRWQNWQNGHI